MTADRLRVRRVYLELRDRDGFRPPSRRRDDVRIEQLGSSDIATYRGLYADVGAPWRWHDRSAWTDETIAAHLSRAEISVWVMRTIAGDTAGYFELDRRGDDEVEIAYFGLRPQFIGTGLGGELLARAVERAWSAGARRVWLHTCSLDSPHALPNYLARGFTQFAEEWYDHPQ